MRCASGNFPRLESMRIAAVIFIFFCGMLNAQKQPVSAPGLTPVGPYSSGILTRDFLYVSGQGAKNAAGQIPSGQEAQLRQCFDNVKAVVLAAGLTMEHVVYAQVYLTGSPDEGPLNSVWKEYFP